MLSLLYSLSIFSQKEKKFIIEGNKNYENKKFVEAEKNYKQGLTKNKDSYKSAFNLGDAYYQQGKYEEAAEQFQMLTHKATSKDTLSKAYHNLGNSLIQSKKYQEGINAYKNALKNNPNDEDTRYNLAYAQKMLQQQQQQNKDDKNDKNNKDDKENKDNKDNKENDKKDKQNENKENKDNKNEKNKEQEKQQGQISKEDAQRLLDALQNDEKNLQDKMKKEKAKGIRVDIEKDW
ncbi:MAG: tetratricopeptide repeat protein [Bacteroidia bacterium]